jgi:protein involved in polysaccharide export with SLBB domain
LRLLTTRAELAELVEEYERTAAAGASSMQQRALTRYEIELIRVRLAEGDFRVGDQISLQVQGEEQLTGSFSVVAGREGPVLRLPLIGDIGLRGVLRSEVEDYLRNEIGRFIREPRVHARAMIRLSVLEGVAQPGFYPVAAEDLLTDVLMAAGGPSATARLDKIRIERGKGRIWTGDALQQAITEGRTLDQLNLQAGDRVIIPARGDRGWMTVLQTTAIVVPAVFALIRIF